MGKAKTGNLNKYLLDAWEKTEKDVKLIGLENETQKSGRNRQDQLPLRVPTEFDVNPVLRPGPATNHILIYPGAFNPPHKGHIKLLRDGFLNGGADLNLVAAIVAPTGDDKLQAKEAAKNKPKTSQNQPGVMLSQKQRVELLEGHFRDTPDLQGLAGNIRLWTFPGLDPFEGYLQQVKKLASLDGYKIEFVSLKGPDHLLVDQPIKHPTYPNCNKIIFTEVLRINEDIWAKDGELKQLRQPWREWERLRGIRRVAGHDGEVWQSTLARSQDSWVRLLTDKNKTRAAEISSTKIRKLITNPPEDMSYPSLIQELGKAGALCPQILLKSHRKNVLGESTPKVNVPKENILQNNIRRATIPKENIPMRPIQQENIRRTTIPKANVRRETVPKENTQGGNTHKRNISQQLKRPPP